MAGTNGYRVEVFVDCRPGDELRRGKCGKILRTGISNRRNLECARMGNDPVTPTLARHIGCRTDEGLSSLVDHCHRRGNTEARCSGAGYVARDDVELGVVHRRDQHTAARYNRGRGTGEIDRIIGIISDEGPRCVIHDVHASRTSDSKCSRTPQGCGDGENVFGRVGLDLDVPAGIDRIGPDIGLRFFFDDAHVRPGADSSRTCTGKRPCDTQYIRVVIGHYADILGRTCVGIVAIDGRALADVGLGFFGEHIHCGGPGNGSLTGTFTGHCEALDVLP